MKSKSEKQDFKSTEKTNKEENQLRKLSDTHSISKHLRPKSSRPPAPNRRSQSNTFTEYLANNLIILIKLFKKHF